MSLGTVFLALFLLFTGLIAGVAARAFARAPRGYEDESGFHDAADAAPVQRRKQVEARHPAHPAAA